MPGAAAGPPSTAASAALGCGPERALARGHGPAHRASALGVSWGCGVGSGVGRERICGGGGCPSLGSQDEAPLGVSGPRSPLELDTPSTGKVTHGLTQPGRMDSPTSAPQLCHLPRKKCQFYCPAWSCSECPLSFGDTSRALPRWPGSVPSAPAGCWEIPTHLPLSPRLQPCRQHLLVPLQPLHLPLDWEPL